MLVFANQFRCGIWWLLIIKRVCFKNFLFRNKLKAGRCFEVPFSYSFLKWNFKWKQKTVKDELNLYTEILSNFHRKLKDRVYQTKVETGTYNANDLNYLRNETEKFQVSKCHIIYVLWKSWMHVLGIVET